MANGGRSMSAQLAPNWQGLPPVFLDNSLLKRAPRNTNLSTLIPPSTKTLIPPPKFLRHKTPQALQGMSCRHSETGRKSRLFLLSKKKNDHSKHKPKKTKNRKTVSYSGQIVINEKTYKVNAKEKQGIYLSIMHKAIEQLEICQEKWSRVLVIRFDLHQKDPIKDNHKVSNFIDNFKRRLQRQYGFDDIGYLWVREHERAKAQHYHCAIYLDGNKIRHSSKVLRIIKDTWEGSGRHKKEGNHVPVIKNPFYFVDNEVTKAKAIYRISYLCKERGKGYHSHYVNDYSASRLTKRFRLPT